MVALATATCASSLGMVPGIGHPLWWGVAATVQFFSLLPDVDTDSVTILRRVTEPSIDYSGVLGPNYRRDLP